MYCTQKKHIGVHKYQETWVRHRNSLSKIQIFNASTCGDNCAPFILKLAKKKDLTINLRHLMDFGKKKFPVCVKVLNTGDVVHSMEELMPVAFKFV